MVDIQCKKCLRYKDIDLFVTDNSKKFGIRKTCKECRKKYLDIWNVKNKDKIIESKRKYIKNNPEKRKESCKKYYKNNKKKIHKLQRERLKDKNGKYYQYRIKSYNKHRDRILEVCRLYRENNKEDCNERIRRWKKTEVGKISSRLSSNKRRTVIDNAIKQITKEDIFNLLKEQNYKCAISREDLRKTGFHIDHIKPISKGGTHTLDNIQLTTPEENLKKGSKWK